MSLRELLNAPEDEFVADHMETDPLTLEAAGDPEEAARMMQQVDFPALPVIDNGRLIGIVRSDEMLEVVEKEASEDMLKHAGFTFTDAQESRSRTILESSVIRIVLIRLPWLLIALSGGLMAGLVIEGFEAELEAVVALAFFLPVIMDMGGNVGTQASTIFVRGLPMGQIDRRNATRHFVRETLIGIVIRVIIGGLGGGAAFVWQGLWRGTDQATGIAAVVFLGLFAVCLIASLVGYLIPWVANELGYDPAAAADPLITTIKDVTALLIYFSLAALLLEVI